jgi:D-sedoheptulose 7-phosphate isomerase
MTVEPSQSMQDELLDHLSTARKLEQLIPAIVGVGRSLCARLERGGTVYTFGNGGSAGDAQHLVGELIGRYARERRPLRAVTLTTDPSVITCIANDYGYDEVFARQVAALAGEHDAVIGLSTSGNSASVTRGLAAARENGALTVLLTGEAGGNAAEHADVVLRASSGHTARIQEAHILIIHLLSELVDRWAAGQESQ